MEQKELELERWCVAYARARGWASWKNEKNGNKGIPDRSFLSPDGVFFMVEFKKDEMQKPRREQVTWLERFASSAFLVADREHFIFLFDEKNKKK